ncbi:MAG: FHA domain-containing protein [Lentisphaeraceae bacterium]|nr:FHA domain-containing protein [Lentisphaeraceae bacterium]
MLDKTINPASSTFDTINSIDDLYNLELSIPKNDRLTPSFFIYEKGEVRKLQIEEGQFSFSIGTDETNEIVINDELSAPVQVSIIRLGNECYFMDCGEKDLVMFNGIQKRQELIAAESRMVIRIGSTWIIYIGIDHHKYDETDSVLLKRSLFKGMKQKNSYGDVLLKLGNHEWYSSSAPILVGSHNSCDFRIDHSSISPFHFIVYFAPAGLYIEDITHGKPGLILDGKPCHFPTVISSDATIQVDKLNIGLYLYGNINDQCNFLYSDLNRQPGLTLSHMKKKGICYDLPVTNRKLTIGRSQDSDIILTDNAASNCHAQIMVRDKFLLLQDNNSTNGTFVNRESVNKSHVKPGDLIEMGDSCLLLHYK